MERKRYRQKSSGRIFELRSRTESGNPQLMEPGVPLLHTMGEDTLARYFEEVTDEPAR